ncbi:DUF2332 domain-containing protein [Frigoribacterium sp. ACAM 257]|uniref:DUF2332 domain-containing protein n=1 Tax=Frigoribacterium sp. ACAM 257 TaxID=2508998 RepID=UPI001748E611|nr:DUF2332 domain-containing protein [Frigoribacterium sp. ACAM 257]
MTQSPTLSDRFSAYADAVLREGSPSWAAAARGVADDAEVLALVERAEEARRQPVLVLAVARWLGAPLGPWPDLRRWLLDHQERFLDELGRRLTQTNDVRRTSPVSLALARVAGPVALLEVGASAGLGLLPDRYGHRAGGVRWGDAASPVQLDVVVHGDLGEVRLPEVVWRAGLDLDPLDVSSAADVAWLDALLPPGAPDRAALLTQAVSVARAAPPRVDRGDAVDDLARLASEAPGDATLVVVSTGTLVYLPGRRRQEFVEAVRGLGARWISYERRGLLHAVPVAVPDGTPDAESFAVLALDGRALAVGDAHGTRLWTTG